MKITPELIKVGTGCTDATAKEWEEPIQAACDQFAINSANRVAAFLANVGVESGGLVYFAENLNYGKQALANEWPNRYAVDPHATPKVPNALAIKLQHNPEAIANNVYANRLGNGDEASGDGWRNRGQGPIQVTGASNLAACGRAIGIDLTADPSRLQKPDAGALSAAWFFSSSGCNELSDTNSISLIVHKINGNMPCDANKGPLRLSRYSDAKKWIANNP